MRLVDSHCHLNADRFEGDADLVIGGARLAGVERILVPGWNVASCERALVLVERFPWLDAAVGVHPHDAAKVDDGAWAGIVRQASDDRVVAIGETGLDYDRVFSPIEDQLLNLRRNLALALETGKPAILHCRSADGRRDAQDALVAELRRGGRRRRPLERRVRGAAASGRSTRTPARSTTAGRSSTSGSPSASPASSFGAGEEASAEVAALVPADRVLIETDSPFLAPPGAPRSRNEPEWVRVTGAWLADQRQVPADQLGPELVAAYDRVFPTRRRLS